MTGLLTAPAGCWTCTQLRARACMLALGAAAGANVSLGWERESRLWGQLSCDVQGLASAFAEGLAEGLAAVDSAGEPERTSRLFFKNICMHASVREHMHSFPSHTHTHSLVAWLVQQCVVGSEVCGMNQPAGDRITGGALSVVQSAMPGVCKPSLILASVV